jgi:hypothetical protein
MRKKKVLSFVGKTNANIITYLLSLALLLKIDRKGWREFKKVILSFLKLRKAAPPRTKPHPPLMKDPRLASYSFVGLDPKAFFSRGDFENQPTEKCVAQVTHSLPLAQMKWDESNQ